MSKTSAKIIADTEHPLVPSARITTFEVYAPRFLLAEINTHRVLAKSAASSRAIPVKKRIEMIEDHGFVPSVFGKNKPGMKATEEVTDQDGARDLWRMAMGYAIGIASAMADSDVHKQHANRILEPFAYYHGVITATEWDNFFALRLHPDAQPEFQELAKCMKAAMATSTPRVDTMHLPYVVGTDVHDPKKYHSREMLDVSAARCARVSYQTHDGKPFNLEADRQRVAQLINGGHMSPFDHAAWADRTRYPDRHEPWFKNGKPLLYWDQPRDHRQFWGWIPDRVQIEQIAGMPPGRRDSYDPIVLNGD